MKMLSKKFLLKKELSEKEKRKWSRDSINSRNRQFHNKKLKIIPTKEILKKELKNHKMIDSLVISKKEQFTDKKLKVVPSKVRLKLNLNILNKLLPNSKLDTIENILTTSTSEKLFQNHLSHLSTTGFISDRKEAKDKNKQTLKSNVKFQLPQSSGKLITNQLVNKSNEETARSRERARKREMFRQEASEKMKAAQFRMINEKLYTTTGAEAFEYFQQEDPLSFKLYHEGYRQQVNKWPVDPLDAIIDSIQKIPLKSSKVIADLGCGEARLAQVLSDSKRTVHSFDLKALNDNVTECDMAKLPLKRGTVDIVVFCLSLMGTNLKEYLLSAAKILKLGGHLKIAEVQSRFENLKDFVTALKLLGFKLVNQDLSNGYFVLLNFIKRREHPKSKLPNISLNPCLYKKR